MPLAADQGVGALVWSPLAWGRLTGKIRRGQPLPEESRLHQTAEYGPPVDDEKLYDIVDALDAVAEETGKTVPQIALNWLIGRPTVASVIIGARNEAQLRQNLGAVGWSLIARSRWKQLDKASAVTAPYPYFPLPPAGGICAAQSAARLRAECARAAAAILALDRRRLMSHTNLPPGR
jgi:aryl-alcohol dehydrogenase-like predicted oxidoreductase